MPRPGSRKNRQPHIASRHLSSSLDILRSIGDIALSPEVVSPSPIFLLSAGWRSGSTLVQRLICSDPAVLMWGEPFENLLPIQRLAASVSHFEVNDDHFFYSIENFSGQLSEEWIANLNPGIEVLRAAHLAYFEYLFAKPAQARGFRRWGIKCVRLSAHYVPYLKWLYPEAQFIFLVRHPLAAYQSYKGKNWFLFKPDYLVNNVIRFTRHWALMVDSFLAHQSNECVFMLRYEDVIHHSDTIDQLSTYLSLHLQKDTLNRKLGASEKTDVKIQFHERIICHWFGKKRYQALRKTAQEIRDQPK